MKFEKYIEEAKEDKLIQKIKNSKDRKELDSIRDLVVGMFLKSKLKKKIQGVMTTKYNELSKRKNEQI